MWELVFFKGDDVIASIGKNYGNDDDNPNNTTIYLKEGEVICGVFSESTRYFQFITARLE